MKCPFCHNKFIDYNVEYQLKAFREITRTVKTLLSNRTLECDYHKLLNVYLSLNGKFDPDISALITVKGYTFEIEYDKITDSLLIMTSENGYYKFFDIVLNKKTITDEEIVEQIEEFLLFV